MLHPARKFLGFWIMSGCRRSFVRQTDCVSLRNDLPYVRLNAESSVSCGAFLGFWEARSPEGRALSDQWFRAVYGRLVPVSTDLLFCVMLLSAKVTLRVAWAVSTSAAGTNSTLMAQLMPFLKIPPHPLDTT